MQILLQDDKFAAAIQFDQITCMRADVHDIAYSAADAARPSADRRARFLDVNFLWPDSELAS